MKGGLKLKNHKWIADSYKLFETAEPEFVSISLKQSSGVEAECVVKLGSNIKKGSLIGKKAKNSVSSNVFSSVCGKVIGISKVNNETVVTIKNSFENEACEFPALKNATREEIIKRVEDAGIVGLSGSGFPTDLKLRNENLNALIINGCECEGYLTCDDCLMQKFAGDVVEGAKLLATACGVKTVIFAIQNNKPLAINKIAEYILENYHHCDCEECARLEEENGVGKHNHSDISFHLNVVASVYPIGSERILMQEIFKIKLRPEELPTNYGVVVNNVQTAYAVFNAVNNGKPLYERISTVSGLSVKTPGNYWIKSGTSIEDVIKFAGGFKHTEAEIQERKNKILAEHNLFLDRKSEFKANKKAKAKTKLELKADKLKIKETKEKLSKLIKSYYKTAYEWFKECLAKIVVGGEITGSETLDQTSSLGLRDNGILFLSYKEANLQKETKCTHCGKCCNVCPARIKPVVLHKFFTEKNYDVCKKMNVEECINCGCCSYVCPSRIPLNTEFQKIKLNLKNDLNKKEDSTKTQNRKKIYDSLENLPTDENGYFVKK